MLVNCDLADAGLSVTPHICRHQQARATIITTMTHTTTNNINAPVYLLVFKLFAQQQVSHPGQQ